MRAYAQGTTVPVNNTRSDIERLLEKHGASGFIFGNTSGSALIAFEMADRRLRFLVPMPIAKNSRESEKKVAAEIRRRWRALLLVLKAKLEAVASKIVTFDEEFLAHIVVSGNTTIGDTMLPQLPDSLARGKMPPLLGAGSVES